MGKAMLQEAHRENVIWDKSKKVLDFSCQWGCVKQEVFAQEFVFAVIMIMSTDLLRLLTQEMLRARHTITNVHQTNASICVTIRLLG